MLGRYRAALIALVAGALFSLAFAPFEFVPFAFISPVILFYLWRDSSKKQSALLGYLFGLGAFGVGVSWVYVAIHVFGNMPPVLAAFSTFMFASLLASFYAALGFLQTYFNSSALAIRFVFVLPAMWVLLEWVRGWILTGFPWLNLGYSQIDTPLGKIAPWLGVYGVSYFSAVSIGLLVWFWLDRQKKNRIIASSLLLIIWSLPIALSYWSLVQPVDGPIKVSLIQGNVPLNKKWRPLYREQILSRYLAMSRSVRSSDLVVWPEAAMPTYLQYLDQDYLRQLQNEARTYSTDFLVGVLEVDPSKNGAYYNSVTSLGSRSEVYRKTHLVPFGEYPPLDPLFRWAMKAMNIPMSDFSSGPSNQGPLQVAGQQVAVSICYENLFGEELIKLLPQATMLVNVSENAWYGDSFAPHQLVQMAQMRSLETGRPGIRVDNAGPSVVIDSSGKIQARTRQFEEAVLTASLQPMTGATPYVRWGNSVIIGWLLIVLFSAYRLGRRFQA